MNDRWAGTARRAVIIFGGFTIFWPVLELTVSRKIIKINYYSFATEVQTCLKIINLLCNYFADIIVRFTRSFYFIE